MNSVYSRLNILPSLKMKIVEIGVLFFLFFFVERTLVRYLNSFIFVSL